MRRGHAGVSSTAGVDYDAQGDFGLDQAQRQQVWAAWYTWALGETGGDDARAVLVATAAIRQLDIGLGQTAALTAGRFMAEAGLGA
ncbi:MAG: hypothetical protein QOE92_669, partial [Chloroflexota bacterium]|nr:hypothetical protein [Chloroflexota bacterium]